MMRALVTLLLIAALSGCAGTNFSYDNARKVQVGMTEAQLIQLMGRPYMVTTRGNEQMWVWSRANGFTGLSRAVSFKMKNGVVSEIPVIPESFR